MIKTIPSKDEMRILVKKIYETGAKLKGNIQINSLDDAAAMAAYLYGFSSWKEYKSVYKNEYEHTKEENFSIKIPKFKPQNYKKNNNFINSFSLIKGNVPVDLKLSKLIPLEWLLGKKRNHIAKIDEPIGLLSDDYIITSSPLIGVNHFLENQLKWLIKYQQTFILFGIENKNDTIHQIIKNANVLELGLSAEKIDPIQEAFENDGLELLLDISPFGEKQTFPWIWSIIVKTLYDEFKFKWTAKKLLESLTIENLLQIMDKITSVNPMIAKALSQYLYKQCGVSEEEGGYITSEEGQNKHYHQIYLIKERLEDLLSLYELGYFSQSATFSAKKCVFEKISTIFLNCGEDKLKAMYWDACNVSYINAVKKQNKEVQLLDSKQYRVWGLWLEADKIMSENIAIELMNNQETTIIGLYILSVHHKLTICFNEIKQIVFLKQHFTHYPSDWIRNALITTETWEDNIWFENYARLKELKEQEAYIWKPKTMSVPKDTEVYELKKIELYKHDPMKD